MKQIFLEDFKSFGEEVVVLDNANFDEQ